MVVRGGRYRPPDCEARHRTAIIIPHRHREHHLRFLLYYLHPFLQRQQLQYGIYVIHQVRRKQTNQELILQQDSALQIYHLAEQRFLCSPSAPSSGMFPDLPV